MICSKQIYLTSRKLEDCPYPVIELLLPINLFWEVESDLKNIDYMLSAHEDGVTINDNVLRLMRKVEPYTISERDRIFLRGKFGGQLPSGTNSGNESG